MEIISSLLIFAIMFLVITVLATAFLFVLKHPMMCIVALRDLFLLLDGKIKRA